MHLKITSSPGGKACQCIAPSSCLLYEIFIGLGVCGDNHDMTAIGHQVQKAYNEVMYKVTYNIILTVGDVQCLEPEMRRTSSSDAGSTTSTGTATHFNLFSSLRRLRCSSLYFKKGYALFITSIISFC